MKYHYMGWSSLARMLLLVDLWFTFLTGIMEVPFSSFTVSRNGGAFIVLVLVGVCSLLVTLDLIINDFMSDRYQINCVRHSRHLIYMLAGYSYLAQAFVGSASHIDVLVSAEHVFEGIVCGLFATIHMREEFLIQSTRRSTLREGQS